MIFVVEDDHGVRELELYALRQSGYQAEGFETPAAFRQALEKTVPDCVLLDVMLPGEDGLSLLRFLRRDARTRRVPVILVTARDAEMDKVKGLDCGADYYLTKPFAFPELLAVVRAMARKYTGNRSNTYAVADLTLDSAAHTVTRGGRDIRLTAKEFALLEYMVRNRGVVLSREMIENNLWNYDYEGGTNVVDVYVGYLRKKVDAGAEKKLIHTVWGTGWVLKEE